jgi:hypothetical protein
VSRPPIPDDFGRDYRRALFALAATPAALRLGWVLLDEAYRRRTTVVELTYAVVRELTLLDGRTLERARDWLVGRRLLEVHSTPRVRSEWVLVLPAALTALVRSDDGGISDRATDRATDRAADRAVDRASAVALSRSRSTSGRRARARAAGGTQNEQKPQRAGGGLERLTCYVEQEQQRAGGGLER